VIELRNLRNLIVLARRLNYARAAEELGVSQPTLSRSIQALERQLGTLLFDRDRGGVALTPQGRLVADRAGVVLADIDDLQHQSRLGTEAKAGRIRFGMTPMPARALLTDVLSERIEAAPDVTHEAVVRDVQTLWDLLTAGEIEFFVSQDGLLPDTSQARVDLLGQFPLCLIVRSEHPLLEDDRSAARYPVVRATWAGVPLPDFVRDHVRVAPNIVEDFGALAGITAATDAIWFTSAYAASEELRSGRLHELPMPVGSPSIEVRMVMYTLVRRSLSALTQALRKSLREQISALNQTRMTKYQRN
jgi:DNA-binding transcriptional LysR family regulator